MLREAISGSCLRLVSLGVVLIVGISGCGGDGAESNDWVGIWAVATVNGLNYEQIAIEELGEEGADVSIVTHR